MSSSTGPSGRSPRSNLAAKIRRFKGKARSGSVARAHDFSPAKTREASFSHGAEAGRASPLLKPKHARKPLPARPPPKHGDAAARQDDPVEEEEDMRSAEEEQEQQQHLEEEDEDQTEDVLAEDVAPTGSVQRGPDFVYLFDEEDSERNIVFAASTEDELASSSSSSARHRRSIKGASLLKLVERVTFHSSPNPSLVSSFLLTYRTFTTPLELLAMLKNRFLVPLPSDRSPEAIEYFRNTRVLPIRLRVFNVLKTWVTSFAPDFVETPRLADELRDFVRTQLINVMESAGKQLLVMLSRSLSQERSKKSTSVVASSKEIPRPHLPQCRPSELSLLTIHPQELARQLTLIEARLFNSIKPWELLDLAWSRKDKAQRAPNVLALIGFTNVFSPWLAGEIVRHRSKAMRVEVLTRCIQTMGYLEELHNFNGLMEYIAALQMSAVARLNDTWAALPKHVARRWEHLKARMSSDNNFKSFRDSLKTISPPAVPYLGVFLTDLTFIEEGNPDMLAPHLINFVKREQCARVIQSLQHYQATPYMLQNVALVGDFALGVQPMGDEELYALSLGIRPRQEGSREIDEEVETPTGGPGTASPASSASETAGVDWGELECTKDYPFQEPDTDDNLVCDHLNHKVIMLASLPKLVERLTYERYTDQAYVRAFLLTHKYMVDSATLLDLLLARFQMPKPRDADEARLRAYEAKVVRPVRLRCFNAVKQWVDRFPVDFQEGQVRAKLEHFADVMAGAGMEKPAERIREVLRGDAGITKKKRGAVKHARVAPPSLPVPSTWDSVMEVPAEEVARQLTLHEHALYVQVGARELLSLACDEEDAHAPNARAMLEHGKWLRRWVASQVVLTESRGGLTHETLEHFVAIAMHFRALNNFFAFVAIVDALMGRWVAYLETAWSRVGSKVALQFEQMKEEYAELQTYSSQRLCMSKVSSPALPSLASYLEELSRVHVSMENLWSVTGMTHQLVNYEKFAKLSSVANEFLAFQTGDYALAPMQELQRELLDSVLLRDDELEPQEESDTQSSAEGSLKVKERFRRPQMRKGSISRASGSPLSRSSGSHSSPGLSRSHSPQSVLSRSSGATFTPSLQRSSSRESGGDSEDAEDEALRRLVKRIVDERTRDLREEVLSLKKEIVMLQAQLKFRTTK